MLTRRERECAIWVAKGKTSWAISKILNISENTVNFHLKNAMRKLDCESRTALVARLMADMSFVSEMLDNGVPTFRRTHD